MKGNRAALNSLCPKVQFSGRLIQTENCLKGSYFISTVPPGQKERLVKEKNHNVRHRHETNSVHQVSSTLSDLQLTVLQLLLLQGLSISWLLVIQTAVVHLNVEISWISFSRVSFLAGTVVESLPMVGIASQHRSI